MAEWEDPPPPAKPRAKGAWAELRAELDAHPGKWAAVRRDFPSYSACTTTARLWRAQGYEVRHHPPSHGAPFTMWARRPDE